MRDFQGMYAFHMRQPDAAESQLKLALKVRLPRLAAEINIQCTADAELWTMANLSLALVYLFGGRESDFYDLYEQTSPAKLRSAASSLKAAAHFVSEAGVA